MQLPIFQLDAFATRLFSGNPAAVIVLDEFLDDAVLQSISAENNLSETAFLVKCGSDYRLRWFTPKLEVPLCGHATLASSAVVMERLEPGRSSVTFLTLSGPLRVTRKGSRYVMSFPSRQTDPTSMLPDVIEALGSHPAELYVSEFNYMAVYENATKIYDLVPKMPALAELDRPGVIVTSPGDRPYDFISRYFAPAKGIPEDPVTGAAHCMLAPYWAAKLGKTELNAYQASRRGGEIVCRLIGNRVELEGNCVFYLEGKIEV